MKVGDVVVHKGFSDDPRLHFGAWGVVTTRSSNLATVLFSRLHSPWPRVGGTEIMRTAKIMHGAERCLPIHEPRQVGEVPSDHGMAAVWEWYGDPIQQDQTDAIRGLWISALRSGEYRQTRYCLRDHKGVSAMGVACDVIGKRYGVSWRWMERGAGILGKYTTMPRAFLKILAISSEEAEFIEKLSDTGMSFRDIANLIANRHAPRMRLAA